MVEAQAVDRVHRIGQEREVVITRYIVRDSVETVCSTLSKSIIERKTVLTEYSMFNGSNKIS